MRLNATGKAGMGTGPAVSVDGATPAALVGLVTGGYLGPCWLTTAKLLYQNGGTGAGPWIIQSYDTGTTATATVSSSGQNELAAGNSVWAAYLSGSGVRTSVGGVGPLANAGLGDVSTDHGEICVVDTRATATGLTVYSSAGATLLSLPAVTLNVPLIRLRGHLLVYSETAGGWKMQNVVGGSFGFAPRINEVINWITPVLDGTTQLVMERSNRLTLRYAAKSTGWQIVAPGGLAFNPDAIALSSGVIRLAWSTNQGESADALQMTDITLSTGATVNWVVSAGALVSSTGPVLVPQQFPVGPLQGSNSGAGLYVPHETQAVTESRGPNKTALTEPYRKLFQSLNQATAGNSAALASTSAPPVPPAGFGVIQAGSVAVAATVPDDTVTVTSADLSVTITTNPATKTVDLSTGGGASSLSAIFTAVSLRI